MVVSSKRELIGAVAVLALSLSLPNGSVAQVVKRVKLAKAGVTVTVAGSIQGRKYVDYTVPLQAGYRLTVGITSPGAEFNLLPPGTQEAAHNSMIGGGKFTGIVPDDGDYVVRVYIPTAAARRGDTSQYSLSLTKAGSALMPLSDKEDARLPGSRFHASGSVQCALPLYPNTKSCKAMVVRRKSHSATVLLTAKGLRRSILFRTGKPVASDSQQKMSSQRKEDNTIVSFEGGERFTIPDALVQGG